MKMKEEKKGEEKEGKTGMRPQASGRRGREGLVAVPVCICIYVCVCLGGSVICEGLILQSVTSVIGLLGGKNKGEGGGK